MVPLLPFGAGVAVGLGIAALAPGLMPGVARADPPAAQEALYTALLGHGHLRFRDNAAAMAAVKASRRARHARPRSLGCGTALALVASDQANILPLQLFALVPDIGADWPDEAALALVLTALCSVVTAAGKAVSVRHAGRD